MLRNYLIIAVRNLMKQKIFTFINVFGLAVGVACCMILGLYVHREWSYERHHPNAEQIYRVVRENIDEVGNRSFTTGTSGALNQLLQSDVPGIRSSVRVRRNRSLVSTDTQGFQQKFCQADPEILNVFDLPLVRGDRQTALTTPNSVLITESVAQKYFGKADPIGKVVREETFHKAEYIIIGVLKDLPKKSFLQFGFLTSQVADRSKRLWEKWSVRVGWMPIETYVVLKAVVQGLLIGHVHMGC